VAIDRSDFFPLTRSRKRLYKVLPTILKAVIPVGAARNTRFCLPAATTSSWIRAHVFKSIKVFLDLVTPSTFKRSCRGKGLLRVSSCVYCSTTILYSFLCSKFRGSGDESIVIICVVGFLALTCSYTSEDKLY